MSECRALDHLKKVEQINESIHERYLHDHNVYQNFLKTKTGI